MTYCILFTNIRNEYIIIFLIIYNTVHKILINLAFKMKYKKKLGSNIITTNKNKHKRTCKYLYYLFVAAIGIYLIIGTSLSIEYVKTKQE